MMAITDFRIHRTDQWATPSNTLVGTVTLKSDAGSMELRLSAATIGKIFMLIQKDAQEVAARNAAQVTRAIEEAANERLVLEMTDAPKID